jgi:hypothetical protein
MKYLLKQNKEDKGILCDKVTIDRFDYYVSDENPSFEDENKYCFSKERGLEKVSKASVDFLHKSFCVKKSKKVIATNNPNIDIAQVVDDVEDLDILKSKWYDNQEEDRSEVFVFQYSGIVDDALEKGIIIGYNKSQEMFPFTEEDMIEFAKYYKVITCNCKGEPPHPNKNSKPDNSLEVHLQIWKEQQPKIVYYNG